MYIFMHICIYKANSYVLFIYTYIYRSIYVYIYMAASH